MAQGLTRYTPTMETHPQGDYVDFNEVEGLLGEKEEEITKLQKQVEELTDELDELRSRGELQ